MIKKREKAQEDPIANIGFKKRRRGKIYPSPRGRAGDAPSCNEGRHT
jgi:hypothetical protein